MLARTQRFMPLVVAIPFVSGFTLFYFRCDGFDRVETRYGHRLLLAFALAFVVLGMFISARWLICHGRMDVCRFGTIHRHTFCLKVDVTLPSRIMFFCSNPQTLCRSC